MLITIYARNFDKDEALVKAWCETHKIECAVKSIEPGGFGSWKLAGKC